MSEAGVSSRPAPSLAEAFHALGFAVLRRFFDAPPLAEEMDRVLRDGLVSDLPAPGAIRFRYVPMMTGETPASLALLDRIEGLALELLGGPVLPTRAKGTVYSGASPWHTDSTLPLVSIGFIAYLEPLGEHEGALRVLPGSHHAAFRDALRAIGVEGAAAPAFPAHVVATEPGDLILMDEHLFHASFGGRIRRQWRVDFLRDPESEDGDALVKSYFAGIYPPDWDGGYDVDRYPSYGLDWRRSSRASVARLGALGVYELAAAQEAFTRSRPRTEPG